MGLRSCHADHASDDAMLWELPWSVSHVTDGHEVEIHPQRSVDEIRPQLLDLLRDGHVEIYPTGDPPGLRLSLDEALAVVADDRNWTPGTGHPAYYCVITTETGDREYEVERAAK